MKYVIHHSSKRAYFRLVQVIYSSTVPFIVHVSLFDLGPIKKLRAGIVETLDFAVRHPHDPLSQDILSCFPAEVLATIWASGLGNCSIFQATVWASVLGSCNISPMTCKKSSYKNQSLATCLHVYYPNRCRYKSAFRLTLPLVTFLYVLCILRICPG